MKFLAMMDFDQQKNRAKSFGTRLFYVTKVLSISLSLIDLFFVVLKWGMNWNKNKTEEEASKEKLIDHDA